ncbi:hypothetical protein DH2020_048531 [Rehmannia glutinosa]|uniref:Glucan endo-1,3-beta-D-glucosidase n=1 Tax=Rehmannia glutinosa TaxID=99300 RepID=A0ABR0U5F1_REHGL
MLRAFADTGIAITVTVPNDLILQLTKLDFAHQWVKTNIVPHARATNIVRILVGNEVLSTSNKLLITNLVPSMQTLQNALIKESLDHKIKISTPHSLGILPNNGVFDENTNIIYANMLDGQLDAVFSAIKRLGFVDIDIVIAETGWPSRGDTGQTGVDAECAAEYNRKLIQHVTSDIGTPLMPNRTFETYIFGLFNEDLKPGPTCERNFGLFRPNFTPVYDIGILKPMVANAAKKIQQTSLVIILLHILDGLLLEYLGLAG